MKRVEGVWRGDVFLCSGGQDRSSRMTLVDTRLRQMKKDGWWGRKKKIEVFSMPAPVWQLEPPPSRLPSRLPCAGGAGLSPQDQIGCQSCQRRPFKQAALSYFSCNMNWGRENAITAPLSYVICVTYEGKKHRAALVIMTPPKVFYLQVSGIRLPQPGLSKLFYMICYYALFSPTFWKKLFIKPQSLNYITPSCLSPHFPPR